MSETQDKTPASDSLRDEFGLHFHPFEDQPDPKFFFESNLHIEALSALERATPRAPDLKAPGYRTHESVSAALLTGGVGTGKTLIAKCLLRRINPPHRGLLMTCLPNDARNLVSRIIDQLGIQDTTDTRSVSSIETLRTALRAEMNTQGCTTLIFDQAENLSLAAVKQLEALFAGLDDGGCMLRIVFLGLPGAEHMFTRTNVPNRRLVRITPLKNLLPEEIPPYIEHRWVVAGGQSSGPFDRQAVAEIVKRSGGNPLKINRLCATLLSKAGQAAKCSISQPLPSIRTLNPNADASTTGAKTLESEPTEGSNRMADQDSTGPVQNTPHSAPKSDRTAAVTPQGDDPRRESLQRMEQLLDRAPETLETLASASADSEQILKRLETRANDLEERLQSTDRRLAGMEETCQKADRVHSSLNEFITQLADIGETSQEKISLLLASLDAADGAQAKLTKLAEQISDLVKDLKPTVQAYQSNFTELSDQCIDRINETANAQIARQRTDAEDADKRVTLRRAELAELLKQTEAAGDLIKADSTAAEAESRKMVAARGAQVDELLKRVEQAGDLIKADTTAADAKSRQMASQLQAAGNVVQQLSESTLDAHAALDQIAQNNSNAEEQRHRLRSAIDTAAESAQRLAELEAKIGPATAAMRECLQGSEVAQDKIERLTQDIWTLTTTTQARSHELSERVQQGSSTITETLGKARAECEEVCLELGAAVETASQEGRNIADLLANGESSASTLRDCMDGAEGMVAKIERLVQDVWTLNTTTQDRARQLTERSEKAAQYAERLDILKNEIDARTAKVAEHNLVAQQRADEIGAKIDQAETVIASMGESCSKAVQAVEERIQSAAVIAQRVDTAVSAGARINEQITAASQSAEHANREVTEMLAILNERRDMIEAGDQTLHQLVERADHLRGSIQQMQTRMDAFTHQLNGMLANPRKIVDEAKSQAGQLETVCRAVRKVFAGLSQSSLQAHRDISRFAKMNREADTRLTRLSTETGKASETMRQWVDEATRAQSRLAQLLRQVPPIAQTHPPDALQNLANVSAETVPGVLAAGEDRGFKSFADRRRDLGGRIVSTAHPEKDFAALIREAEQAAEANS